MGENNNNLINVKQNTRFLRAGRSSVGKMLGTQARGPEFRPPAPDQDAGQRELYVQSHPWGWMGA